ncbi:hypothetical protein Patl1_19492 [Pistacia atlantica]|uniref:Uncharacterized protein n=1 Tax=Pistacia atlantica TaxID=434234 RepID=A0ACC1C063_9ROSI|nr:hypothetical protein Patl1_19492 [Pistacia atlantica]
MVFYWSIHCIT